MRFLLALLLCISAKVARASDLDVVEGRLRTQLLASIPSTATIQGYQTSMLSTGLWSDINYSDHSQTNWIPQNHLSRLYAMCQGYNKTGNTLYQDATLKAAILKAYDAWFAINPYPTSTNWWYQDIGAAQAIGNIMVLMKADLSAAQITKGAAKITADPDGDTGLNAVDEATAKICKGIAQGNSTTVSQGFASIGKVIFITTGEGIQRDGTFLQHGPQLYNQGYGSGYISSVLTYSVLGADTIYEITAAQQKILTDYILDGSQHMVRGESFDYTAFGRGLSRNSPSSAGNGLIGPATNALALGTYRADELNALITRQTNSRTNHTASTALAFVGNRHFWRGDLSTHHRPDFYASVKISSTRTSQPEAGNGEGLKNLYLGDGVAQIMRTGNEYDDIMPVWDWRRLPGTTVEQDSRSLRPANSAGTVIDWGVTGTATYAGGVSDGSYGATAFNYSRYRVAAKKSWFHFDDEVAALGTAINASTSTAPVFTTLNQCLLNGPVTYKTSGGTTTLATGSTVTPSGLSWVHHDGTGYFFPTPVNNATIKAVSQSGTWQSLNTGGSSTTINKNVFSLYVSQAAGATGGSYQYLVVPGIAVEDMDAYLAANPVQVLRNDSTAQATRNTASDVTQAAFYAAGSVTLDVGETLAANDKAVVQLRRSENELQITAASPEARTMVPQFTLGAVKLSGGAGGTWFDALGSALSTISLPGGDLAGSSIGYTLSHDAAAAPTVTLANTLGSGAVSHTASGAMALPGNTTFQTDANSTLGLNGIVSGDFSITKTGGGTLNLGGANTYGGTTTVTAGVMNVSGNQSASTGSWLLGTSATSAGTISFQNGSRIVVGADKQVRLGNNSASGNSSQTMNVVGTVTNAGSLYVGRPGVLNINSGATWTQDGPMSVNSHGGYSAYLNVNTGGTFTYTGSSTIKLEPGSSGSGVLTIGGTFQTSAGFQRTVTTSDGGGLITFAGGTLRIGGDVPALATGNVVISTGALGGTIHTNGFDAALANSITGTGGLTKAGAGSLTLSGTNAFSGGLTVAGNGGTLIATSPAALGSGTINILKGSTQTGTLALQFTGTNTITNSFGGFGSTTFTEATQPCIENLSGTTTITSPLTVTSLGGNGLYVKSSGGILILSGVITHSVGSIRSFGLAGDADGFVTGNILNGTGGFPLSKDGAGTWTLTGTNTYEGGTTINGGTLRIGNGGATGTPGSGSIGNQGILEIKRSNAVTFSNPIYGTGSIVQSGTGTTTLTGALSYSGPTRVAAGTLVLPNATLSNSAPVEISQGALLTLSFSGTDTIQSLVLEGELQLAGTWGAPDSGAEHETPLIAGPGMLLVTTGFDPYLPWIAGFSVSDSLENADPDHDGLSNLIEYALDLDPTVVDVLPLPVREGGMLKLRYPLNLSASNTTVIPEWSDNLSSWHPEGITISPVGEDVGTTRQLEATVPLGTDTRKFMRLRVVK